jgi:hypothetical protein
MAVSHFDLFDVTRRAPNRTDPLAEPLPGLAPDRCGPVRIANDNNPGAGPRRMPRPQRSLLRFLPHRLRAAGLA